jgi:hypothetical protein
MKVVILILLAGTLGALGAAGDCYTVALTEARRHFPLEFQDEHSSRAIQGPSAARGRSGRGGLSRGGPALARPSRLLKKSIHEAPGV